MPRHYRVVVATRYRGRLSYTIQTLWSLVNAVVPRPRSEGCDAVQQLPRHASGHSQSQAERVLDVGSKRRLAPDQRFKVSRHLVHLLETPHSLPAPTSCFSIRSLPLPTQDVRSPGFGDHNVLPARCGQALLSCAERRRIAVYEEHSCLRPILVRHPPVKIVRLGMG